MDMLLNSEYQNDIMDDLCLSPIDYISQNQYSTSYYNLDPAEIFSPPEIDQESITNTSSQKFILSDLTCGVCGAPATGYNFDQITCESCKAFFRRNAFRDMTSMKCRFSGSCVINIKSRRQCAYCRLNKCFSINMRKDWIRTEEEIEMRQMQKLAKEQKKLNRLSDSHESPVNLPIVVRKKKRLMITPITQDILVKSINKINSFGFHHNLSNDDRIILNNITNAYQLGASQADSSHIDRYPPSTPFLQFINDETVMHSSLIWFYKSILDFKQIDIDDQLLLIKCNLLNIIHLHHIIVQNFQDNPIIGKHMAKWIDPDFHKQMSQTRRNLYYFAEHPLVLKLALIVLIFSINLSIPRGSSQFDEYKNPGKIYELQNYYIDVLWRYLNSLYNEREATHAVQIIVIQILRYQKLMVTMESRVREDGPHMNILHSLMQSIFGLS